MITNEPKESLRVNRDRFDTFLFQNDIILEHKNVGFDVMFHDVENFTFLLHEKNEKN